MKNTWTDSYAKFADIDSDDDGESSDTGRLSSPLSFTQPTRFECAGSVGHGFKPTSTLDYGSLSWFAEKSGRARSLPQQKHEVYRLLTTRVPHCYPQRKGGLTFFTP